MDGSRFRDEGLLDGDYKNWVVNDRCDIQKLVRCTERCQNNVDIACQLSSHTRRHCKPKSNIKCKKSNEGRKFQKKCIRLTIYK